MATKLIQKNVQQDIDICPECKSENLLTDYDTKETYCGDCGLVIGCNIDMGPEWRAYSIEEKLERPRVGAPITHTLHNKGLSTNIDWRDIEKFKPEQKSQLYRLRKWQNRSRISDSIERNLAIANNEIGMALEKLGGIPKVVKENICLSYRKAKEFVRGRSIKGVAAAVTYSGLRKTQNPRTLDDVAEAFNFNKKDLARLYRLLVKELDLNIPIQEHSKYISKICSGFDNEKYKKYKGKTEEIANKIINAAKQNRVLPGKSPIGISAAAVYIGSILAGKKMIQKEISEVSGVTEVTIRNRYQELNDELQFIISL